MIFKKLFQKSRLPIYQKLLEYALNAGYSIIPVCETGGNGNKILWLRHDIDKCLKSAREVYLLEKKIGVRSSFYFRWRTMKPSLMRDMHNDGFEVSLHYETLASLKIKHVSKLPLDTPRIIQENLEKEICLFFTLFGWELQTIACHGAKRNRRLEIPNTIIKHPLDASDYDIRDSSIKNNHQWLGGEPVQFIDQGKSFVLVTHPVHWYYSPKKNIKTLLKDIYARFD